MDLPPSDEQPPATSPVPGSGPRRRPVRLLAAAAGLALVLVLAGLVATRQPPHATPGAATAPTHARTAPTGTHAVPTGTGPAGTGPSAGDPIGTPTTGAPGQPTVPSGPSPTTTTAPSTTPTGPAASTGTPPVTVAVTATPASGTCTTNFNFVAHFTITDTTKYRWHWVFGGHNGYSSTSGDHDQNKTGNVPGPKKFDTRVSGTYWGQIQITSPVTVNSDPATVQLTCGP
jgi:hypothetical protein